MPEEASHAALNEATFNSKVTSIKANNNKANNSKVLLLKDQTLFSVVCQQLDSKMRGTQDSILSIKVPQQHSLAHKLRGCCNDRHLFKVRLTTQFHPIFDNQLPISLDRSSISLERTQWPK